jgi:hypothetical protein
VQGDPLHRHGSALDQLAQHAGDRRPVARVLRVEKGVVADPGQFEGPGDLVAVGGDHRVHVHADVLGLGEHVVGMHVDAGQGQHPLAPGAGGPRGDVAGQVRTGQVADVQRTVDRRLRNDDDRHTSRLVGHLASSSSGLSAAGASVGSALGIQ